METMVTKQFDGIARALKAMADPTRLQMLGLLAERPRTGKELAEATGVGAPTVSHHVERLVAARLVAVTREGQSKRYALDQRALTALSRLAAGDPSSAPTVLPSSGGADDSAVEHSERAKVLRDFFDGERLRQIPAQRKRRVIVLQHLLERFHPGQDYAEREVNALLKTAHEDVATLRRELVDYGYLTRAAGVYRVAQDVPPRSANMAQEITGDEHGWLRAVIVRATISGGPAET